MVKCARSHDKSYDKVQSYWYKYKLVWQPMTWFQYATGCNRAGNHKPMVTGQGYDL